MSTLYMYSVKLLIQISLSFSHQSSCLSFIAHCGVLDQVVYDKDNPSGTGVWEVLSDLRRAHPGETIHYALKLLPLTQRPQQ